MRIINFAGLRWAVRGLNAEDLQSSLLEEQAAATCIRMRSWLWKDLPSALSAWQLL